MAGNLDLNVIISASFDKLKQGVNNAVNVMRSGTAQMEQSAAKSKKALDEALGGANLRAKRRELTQTINEQRSILTLFKQDLINLENKLAQTSKGDLMRQKALKNAIASLKVEIKDQEGAIRSLSDTRSEANYTLEEGSRTAEQNTQAMEAMSRAINAASMATLLFAGDNENVSNVMQGVRVVMGLASAAIAVYNLAQRENEIFTAASTQAQAVYAAAVGTSTGAMKAFRLALLATGIGVAIAVVGSLASAFSELNTKSDGLTDSERKLRDANNEAAAAGYSEAQTIRTLTGVINSGNSSQQTRLQAYEELKKSVPVLEGYTLDEAAANNLLTSSTEKAIQAILARSRAEVFAKAAAEEAKRAIDTQNMTVEESLGTWDKLKSKLANVYWGKSGENYVAGVAAAANKTELLSEAVENQAAYQELANKALNEALVLEGELSALEKPEEKKKDKGADKAANDAKRLAEAAAKFETEQQRAATLAQLDEFEKRKKALEFDYQDRLARAAELGVATLDIETWYAAESNKISDEEKAYKLQKVKEWGESINQAVQEALQSELTALQTARNEKETALANEYANGLKTKEEYNGGLLAIERQFLANQIALFEAAGKDVSELQKQYALTFLPDETKKKLSEDEQAIQDFTNNLNKAAEGVSVDAFAALGQVIGGSLAGSADAVKNAFSGLFNSIAGFFEQFGKALIAQGLAINAFKESLKSLSGATAVVAGVALIATAQVVKATIAKGATPFADGGIVSGPTLGLMGEYPGASSNPEVIAPLDKLQSMLNVSGGGNFVASTKFDGRDLWLAVNRYDKNKTRG